MPKITEARRAQRRTQVLDAAQRCFGRNGYQRTSMADIIRESGLSAGAIYGYFPSKQELIRAVVERVLDATRAELAAASSSQVLSPAQIMALLIGGIRTDAPTAVVIQAWAEATVDDRLRSQIQDVMGQMRGALARSLLQWAEAHPDRIGRDAQGWATATAPILLSMMPGFVLQDTLIDDFSADAFIAALPGILP